MVNDISEELLKMQKEIENDEKEKSKAEGKYESAMSRLKSEFGFKTVASAKKKLDEMKDKRQSIMQDLDTGMEKLKSEYDWNNES